MKRASLITFIFLFLLINIIIISAANFSVSTSSPASISKSVNQTSFLITPNLQTGQAINMVVTLPQQISDGTNTITLNPPYTIYFNNVSNGQTQGPVIVSYTLGTIPTNFNIGTFTSNAIINAIDITNSSNTVSTIVPINFVSDFCTNGENGTDLSITRVDLRNSNGDDTTWYPLDPITVKVEVTNDGSSSIASTYVEIGLIDPSGKNVINNMDNLADKRIEIGTISSGESITKTFTFNVPVDFNIAYYNHVPMYPPYGENYQLVVKAYSNDSGGQKALCTAHSSDLDNNYYESILGLRESDDVKQVVVNNVVLSPDTAQCGDNVKLSGDIANIGDTYYEDRIKVSLYNEELGLYKETEIRKDLQIGNSISFAFDFDIPLNSPEKNYTLNMRTYYDYYTTDGTYNIVSDRIFTKSITVQGNYQSTNFLFINNPSPGIYNTGRLNLDINFSNILTKLELIDYGDRNPRWSTLCSNCKSYNRLKSFSDGVHNLTIKGTLPGEITLFNQTSFFIDSKPPQIFSTGPRSNSFTNGSNFIIKYNEANLINSSLIVEDLTINQSCPSGNQQCIFNPDLNQFDGQKVQYYFILTDIAGNTAQSRPIAVNIDTTPPIINNPDSFWNQSGKYINFNIIINETNFDSVKYIDKYQIRWNTLCSDLKKGICNKKLLFRTGSHSLTIEVLDKAGNSVQKSIGFTI